MLIVFLGPLAALAALGAACPTRGGWQTPDLNEPCVKE